jgi:Integrase core domain
MNESEH